MRHRRGRRAGRDKGMNMASDKVPMLAEGYRQLTRT
jgi:hypothetical protein